MRSFHPIFYASLIVLAVSNTGCDIGIKIIQKLATAVEEGEVKETPLEYHQRRMREVDGPGWTDLHRAAAKGDVVTVQKLLDQGVPVDVREHKGGTPLYEAARRGQLEVMKLLLKNGAKVDDNGREGATPLWVAAEYNQVEVARFLLKNGADANYHDNVGYTPLHQAAQQEWHRNSEFVRLLVEEGGADVNDNSSRQCSPLYCAVNSNHTPVALYLLSMGADVNYVHPGGTQTLYSAVINQNYKVVKALLDKGANPNTFSKAKYTPLQRAAFKNDILITRLLLQYKADPNLTHGDSGPPLYWAMLRLKNRELVLLLLEHGADPTQKVSGISILKHAVFERDQEMVDLITEFQRKQRRDLAIRVTRRSSAGSKLKGKK